MSKSWSTSNRDDLAGMTFFQEAAMLLLHTSNFDTHQAQAPAAFQGNGKNKNGARAISRLFNLLSQPNRKSFCKTSERIEESRARDG